MDSALTLRFEYFGIAMLMAFFISYYAYLVGFYRIPFPPYPGPFALNFRDVMGAFGLFLSMEVIFAPALIVLALSIKEGHIVDIKHLPINHTAQGWLNFFVILLSSAAIIGYALLMTAPKQKELFWVDHPPKKFSAAMADFSFGAITWLVAYPIIVAIGQAVGVISEILGPPPHIDQVAVKHLKSILNNPFLFSSTVMAVILLVPVAEEILFRGFLQRWLIEKIGRWRGITFAAALFSIFHFSISQKWENVELLLSLFVLGCFLGFLFERRGSLWAPIGLHVTFNAISVLMILGGKTE